MSEMDGQNSTLEELIEILNTKINRIKKFDRHSLEQTGLGPHLRSLAYYQEILNRNPIDVDTLFDASQVILEIEIVPTVGRPPAHQLVSLLKFIFTKKCFEHIFAQTIVDMREEYDDAIEANNIPLARWRHIQLYLSLTSTVLTWIGASSLKKFFAMWKAI